MLTHCRGCLRGRLDFLFGSGCQSDADSGTRSSGTHRSNYRNKTFNQHIANLMHVNARLISIHWKMHYHDYICDTDTIFISYLNFFRTCRLHFGFLCKQFIMYANRTQNK